MNTAGGAPVPHGTLSVFPAQGHSIGLAQSLFLAHQLS